MAGNNQRAHITGDGKQELQYLKFHNLALEPVVGNTGQFYYNTVTKLLGIYDGSWSYLPKSYLGLSDTTDTTYTAKAGYVPMVNVSETGLDLVNSELATFLILADTPSTYIGQGGKVVRVNVAETALEFLSTASLVTGVTDGIFNLDVSAGLLTVTPYIAQTSAAFDSSSTNPVGTTRLNYNGYFYATRLNARASDYAIIANATGAGGVAVLAQADTITSIALSGASSLGIGVYGLTVDGLAFKYQSIHATNNDAYKLGQYVRVPGVATLSGIGMYNSYSIQNANLTVVESGRIYNKLTTTTHFSEVSSFEWWLVNAGVLAKKMELKGSGQLLLAGYGTGAFSLGTPTYYLQVDANGNILEGALGAGSMVYPAVGIALSTGSSWGASIINNSTQWNTAYGWGNHAGLYAIAPAANTADYIPQWNGTNSKVLKDGLAVPAGGLAGNTALAAKQPRLTITGVKVSNYSANADEFVPYDISASNPTLTLPTAPATGTIIQTKIIVEGTTRTLEVKTGGTDTFNIGGGGDTSIYYNLLDTVVTFTYNSSTGVWYVETTAPPSAFAMGFPGIDAQTPITNSDISIDTSTFVLTITPPLGYFYVNAAGGNGKNIRIRKTGVINFPAFTDTSGIWYFYFDNTGTPITTQVAWTSEDFANISPVYRIVWNATLAGAARLVRRFVEYHLNDIPHDTHVWMHLHGAIWSKGLDIASNVIASPTSPASDGSNAVIALSTGTCIDDNLAYTITNDSTPTNDWEQDLGDITPASLNATNSAMFYF